MSVVITGKRKEQVEVEAEAEMAERYKLHSKELKRERAEARAELLRRKLAESKQLSKKIIEEKRKAEKEFMKKLSQQKAVARQEALAEYQKVMENLRAQFMAKLSREEKETLKRTPMNLRRMVKQQLQLRRAEAIRQFELKAKKAEEQYKLELEKQLSAWEKSQIQEFAKQEQKWAKSIYQQLDVKYEELEKSLETSLEQALASIPQGAEIKEIKFEEGAWKISYEFKREQATLPKTIEQPKTWTEQFAEWYSSAPIPGRMLKEALGDLFRVPKPVRQITEKSPVSHSIVGDVASFESFVKGIAHISVELTPPRFTPKEAGDLFKPLQIRAIEHPEVFVEHRKWQMKMHKLIGPSPPTLSGVAFSYALSPIFGTEAAEAELKRLMEWEKRYPGYIEGTVLGDVLISILLGEGFGRLYRRIRGAKVTRLVGAVEDERIFVEEGRLVSIRKIKPIFKTERISLEEYRYLKELTRYFQPERVELYGEKLLAPTWKEWPLPAKAFHPPEPFIAAAEKVPSYGYKVSGFRFGEKLIKIWQYVPPEKLELPTITEKIIVRSPAFEAPVKLVSTRTYTLAQVVGEIDRQVYLNFLRNVPVEVGQKWLKQMGAVSPQILRKVPSATIPVSTQILKVELQTPSLIEKMIAGFTLKSLISAPAFKAKPAIKTEINVKEFSLPTISIKSMPKIGIGQLPKLKPKLSLKQSLEVETVSKMKISIPKEEFKLPRLKGRKRKKPVGFYGWLRLEVPIPSAKEILSLVVGGKRRRKRKR
ncbi:hypothetical protein DRO19_01475 [Candidatus Bathyarchaeota archaeon]|nr:MAG: hypothetical protein DRO19_01475 [Candidatus Bathyarchaeota archaeon]